jgi:hypothetical protein
MDKGELGAAAMNQPVTVEATISHLPPRAARMAAIEILLADPAALDDDTLESGLYILREKARGRGAGSSARRSVNCSDVLERTRSWFTHWLGQPGAG